MTAIRVICHYQGSKVSLVSAERVDALTPETDPLEGSDKQAGFWAEIRGPKRELLYRQLLPDFLSQHLEVSNPPDEEQRFLHAERTDISGHVVLLLPELPEAQHVALVRAQAIPDTKSLERIQIWALDLTGIEEWPTADSDEEDL